jgi:hypothetical protein
VAKVPESLFAWVRFSLAAFEGLLVNHGAPVALHRLWAAIRCAAIMPSDSSFAAAPIRAATVALNCLSRVSGPECFSQSACTVWLARMLFH